MHYKIKTIKTFSLQAAIVYAFVSADNINSIIKSFPMRCHSEVIIKNDHEKYGGWKWCGG